MIRTLEGYHFSHKFWGVYVGLKTAFLFYYCHLEGWDFPLVEGVAKSRVTCPVPVR